MLKEFVRNWSPAEYGKFVKEAKELNDSMWLPIKQGGLWPYLSPKELLLAESTAVTITARMQTDCLWRSVSFETLLWALGVIEELPPYGIMPGPEILQTHYSDSLTSFLNDARLRDAGEIRKAREIAQSWHWRSRTRYLIERGDKFPSSPSFVQQGFHCFDDIIRFVAGEMYKIGELPQLIDGDFPVYGKAYRDLNEEEWSNVQSMSMERHFALNWLCGYAPNNAWDATPTDT
jgi:hypothetical protein